MTTTRHATHQEPGRFSVRKALIKSFLLLFIPSSIILSTVFIAFNHLSKEYETQTALIREAAALNNASEIASLLLEQKLADLLVLAEGEALREFLHDDTLKNRIHLTREFALLARRKPKYAQIRLLDTTGKEILRVNNSGGVQEIVPRSELQDKSHRYYFSRTLDLSEGEIYISPMDLLVEHGRIVLPHEPTIRFSTPVFDGYGAKRGIVIINFSPDELLARIGKLYLTMLGDAVLLNSEGYWLMGAPEEKLWGFMFDNPDTFAKEHPNAWSIMDANEYGTYDNGNQLFMFHKSYLVHRERLGSPENVIPYNNTGDRALNDPYWILVSQISTERIESLYEERALISSATHLILILVAGIISYVFARMSAQKQSAYQQLHERAVTDDLTGTANRRELNKIGKLEFMRAQRFDRPLSILMLDLDHFKDVNDTFGHSIGDQVLKHISTICLSTIRIQDLLARYGGEEFVVVMPETNIQGAILLADRICFNIRNQPYHLSEGDIPLTVSIGVSTLTDSDDNYEQILLRADKALYLAKDRGRDRVEVMMVDKDHSVEQPEDAVT